MSRKLEMERKELEKKREDRWIWIIGALCLAFAVVTIVIIVIALEPSSSGIPSEIDIVLYQSPSRPSRYIPQSKAVHRYMGWARNVYVLSSTLNPGWDPTLNIEVVPFVGSASQAFEYMPLITGIASHSIFLSDMTVPFRDVKKTYMFYQTRPRIFNIFRDQAEVNFLSRYLELPTMPVLSTDLEKLNDPPRTWQDLVFREITEERIVMREDMNRDVFVVSSMLQNVEKQFEKLVSTPPLFATFHVNPDNDPNPTLSNNTLMVFLSTHFQ